MSSKLINTLYVTSESLPYIKIQSLGDISFSFVMAMREQSIDIRLTMPRYGVVSERKHQIHYIKRLTDIPIPIGKEAYPASIKSSSMNSPRTKVQAYITTNEKYFSSRKGVYRDGRSMELFPDNEERFLYFCRSVVETCNLLEWVPDIVHCVDGETALAPAFFKLLYPEKFAKTKFVLTIHNIEEQSISGKSFYEKTGLPKQYKEIFFHQNKFNALKAGIHFADSIVFTNPVYAKAVLESSELSNGLNEFLKEKEIKIFNNGIDTFGWDPRRDKNISFKLADDFEEFKYSNKVSLFQKFGADFDPSIPVFGLILDMNEYEAIDYFVEYAPELLRKENFYIFLLARIEARFKNTLKLLAKKYKKTLKVIFTNELSYQHQLFAGSDFYLSFDNHDPTNMNLMFASKYGTLPVANNFYLDTNVIKPFDEKNNKGFALTFQRDNTKELYNTVNKAIKIFEDKDTFNTLIERAKSQNFSWDHSAKEYKALYTKLVKGK